MRIIYLLLHDFRFASLGVEEFAFKRYHFAKEYARLMSRRGHDVRLYILADGLQRNQVIDVDGFEIKAFRTSFRFPPFARFGNDHSFEAMRELGRDSPEVVHLHNYYLWNFPYVAAWAKRTGAPLVSQYHGTDPIRRLKGLAFQPALAKCERILAPLPSELEFLNSLRLSRSRVLKFPSTGVDTEEFRRTSQVTEECSLLYVGRIPELGNYRWEKAPQYILPILKALRLTGVNARLTVVGDGPGLPAMVRQSEDLKLGGAVDFKGALAHWELPAYYSRSRFTFVPFVLDEISPYWDGALQESLACGTPVIGFNNSRPGHQDFGILVPTDPVKASRLIAPALAEKSSFARVSQDGPEAIRRVCDWKALARQLEGIYRGVAG